MKINATVSIQISISEFETRTFSIDIPDEIIEAYARNNLDLMSKEEAETYATENPPDYDDDEDK